MVFVYLGADRLGLARQVLCKHLLQFLRLRAQGKLQPLLGARRCNNEKTNK